MSTPDRQELIRNAVAFLSDTKTQSSPLAQRIQFLEAKGLTGAEIEEAFKYAATDLSAPPVSYQPIHGPVYGPPLYPVSSSQQWDWRDYFITAVFSGSIAYGAVSLFKKYLLPHLQPPTSTAYEEDRDALNAQFDAAEALLKEIQTETAAVRTAVAEQKEKVDQTTQEVEAIVNEMREAETKTRDDMREIREEVNNVREMLPKMIDKVKESQSQSLTELQQELKSLKALLLSRGPSISSTPSSPLPALASRPSIPAWQLARPTPSPAPAITDSVETTISSESLSGSKGKEVDIQQISESIS